MYMLSWYYHRYSHDFGDNPFTSAQINASILSSIKGSSFNNIMHIISIQPHPPRKSIQ